MMQIKSESSSFLMRVYRATRKLQPGLRSDVGLHPERTSIHLKLGHLFDSRLRGVVVA